MFGGLERLIYRVSGVNPKSEMGWKRYTAAVMLFNILGFVVVYALLRLQNYLPFNTSNFSGLEPRLAFNTASSFATNTNWQSYGGESTIVT